MLGLKLGNSINNNKTGYNIYSVDLDGVDAYIDISESANYVTGQSGSCSVWFKIDSTSTSSTIWQGRVDSNNYVNVLSLTQYISKFATDKDYVKKVQRTIKELRK